MMRANLTITVLMLSFSATADTTTQDPEATFHAGSQVVTINVVARDRRGRFVETLVKDDLTIRENGGLRTILNIERQHIASISEPGANGTNGPNNSVSKNAVADTTPRRIAIVFDLVGLSAVELERSKAASKVFITGRLGTRDEMSIFTGGRDSQRITEFTSDRELLLSAIDKVALRNGMDGYSGTPSVQEGDLPSNGTMHSLLQAAIRLDTLRKIVESLRSYHGLKALVYFSHGLETEDPARDNMAGVTAVVQAAVRNSVLVFPTDSRGLESYAPMGNASVSTIGADVSIFNGVRHREEAEKKSHQYDKSFELAKGSGGRVTADANNLELGLIAAQRMISEYYIVQYYGDPQAEGGKWHDVNITTRIRGIRLSYPPGYVEPFRFANAESSPQLTLATLLRSKAAVTNIPVVARAQIMRHDNRSASVLITARRLDRHIEEDKMSVYLAAQVYDERGHLICESLSATGGSPVSLIVQFGDYSVRVAALFAKEGSAGIFEGNLKIPNLNSKRGAFSSIIWGHSSNQLSRPRPNKELVNSLAPADHVVLPRRDTLVAMCEYYGVPGSEVPDIVFNLTVFRDGILLAQSPIGIVRRWNSDKDLETATIVASLSAKNLHPGTYTVQFSAVDRNNKNYVFERSELTVLEEKP